MIVSVGNTGGSVGRHASRPSGQVLVAAGLSGLLALSTGLVLGARSSSGNASGEQNAAPERRLEPPAESEPRAAPSISGVVELRRIDPSGVVVDAISYAMPSSQSALDWPAGSGAGGTTSGVARFAWPRLGRAAEVGQSTTTLAVTNLVTRPGWTDFAILLYDQNSLVDYVPRKLNEQQTEYISLETWGFINPGWIGSAIVSACFWEHEIYSDVGEFQRDLVGLAGVAFDSWSDRGSVSGDLAAGGAAVPLIAGLGPEYGPAPMAGGRVCGRSPWMPSPTPKPTPIATSATPTPSPTPTPAVPPPYAPGAPEVNLPALAQLRLDDECLATVRIQNVGVEDTKALVAIWGPAGSCAPGRPAPGVVLCSGLVRPGATWEFASPLPSQSRSAIVFSLTTKTFAEIGVHPVNQPATVPVADAFCDELRRSASIYGGYDVFRLAYDTGSTYGVTPMRRAWGAPLAVQVHRSCEDPPGIDLGVESSYSGASGPDLGYAAAGESYAYALPRVAVLEPGHGSVIHVQNAGYQCSTVELTTYAAGSAANRCEAPVTCAVPPVPPGESVLVDLADCRPGGFEGSAVIRSSVPLAIAVDDTRQITLGSYLAKPTSLRDMHGQPLLGASGSVSFAPLLIKNSHGWTSRMFVQDLGPGQTTLKVSLLARSGDVVSTGWFGPLCPFESTVIDLETMPGVPNMWVGSARVESYAVAPPEATPWVPAPTSTPERTVAPSPTPTRCTGTCPPTETPTRRPSTATPESTPTERPTATATAWPPVIERWSLYLPACQRPDE